jgi:hypothetical protein
MLNIWGFTVAGAGTPLAQRLRVKNQVSEKRTFYNAVDCRKNSAKAL